MKALSREQLIKRLVSIVSRLAEPTDSDGAWEGDAALIELRPAEKAESLLLVRAAGFGFIVPGNSDCSLLTLEELRLLNRTLESWNDLSFQHRALVKEALLLLSTILLPLSPRTIGKRAQEDGEPAMREMAIARMQLKL